MTFQPKLLYVLPQETAAVLMLETTIFPKELPAPGSFTKKSNPWHYYQWGVFVKGTRSWIHSEMYRGTSNKKLIASTYNGLGTNQTTACIRVQAGNAKLIYDIAKTNRYSIPIRIYRSSNKGPFGKITLNDTTGKIPGNQNYDPTDPAFKNKR